MPQKILFVDRDGTLIQEPEDYQIDSFEKLTFVPGVFSYLGRIAAELDYRLVMVTNQDGLGTDAFPEETFWGPHRRMLDTLAGEGIAFDAVHIDRSFERENLPTRKPGTGLLTEYLTGDYDLVNSYVIGDRASDVRLAENLGCGAFFLHTGRFDLDFTPSVPCRTVAHWREIYEALRLPARAAEVRRTTRETDISVRLNLDGTGQAELRTGLGFFDHMLEQIARHGGFDLTVQVEGDLHVDEHHTVEDTALALGEAFRRALGDKRGIARYGFLLPMDDSLARVALDFSGRAWLVWEATFQREKIGDVPTEMFSHFFKSFADAAACNLNVHVEGENEHHKIEAIFKAFAQALRKAVRRDPQALDALPSTKGVL